MQQRFLSGAPAAIRCALHETPHTAIPLGESLALVCPNSICLSESERRLPLRALSVVPHSSDLLVLTRTSLSIVTADLTVSKTVGVSDALPHALASSESLVALACLTSTVRFFTHDLHAVSAVRLPEDCVVRSIAILPQRRLAVATVSRRGADVRIYAAEPPALVSHLSIDAHESPLLIAALNDGLLLVTDARLHLLAADPLALVASADIPGPLHSSHAPQTLADVGGIVSSLAIAPCNEYGHVYLASDQGDVLYVRTSNAAIHAEHVCSIRSPIACIAVAAVRPSQIDLKLFGPSSLGACVTIDSQSISVVQSTQAPAAHPPPIHDATIARLAETHDSIFLACGLPPSASICRIHHGVPVAQSPIDASLDGIIAAWPLSASPHSSNHSIVILSFFSASRTLMLVNDALEDISDSAGLATSSQTIAASAMPFNPSHNAIIQIHTAGITVALPLAQSTHSSSWSWTPPQTITLAAIHNNHVLAVLHASNCIRTFTITTEAEKTSINIIETQSLLLPAEPSAIYASPPSNPSLTPLCIVGTYDSAMLIFSFVNETLYPVANISLSPFSDEPINPPHSIAILEQSQSYHESRLLVGLRDGSLLDFNLPWSHIHPPNPNSMQIDSTNTSFFDKPPTTLLLGKIPLALVSSCASSLATQPHILALSETPWRISQSPLGDICLEPLLHDPITHAAPFILDPISPESNFLSITDNKLQLIQVATKSQHHMHTIPIDDIPRRIIFDPLTKLLVLATLSICNGKSISSLKVIDPITGSILRKETDCFEPNEVVHSLAIWHVKSEKRYICVGTRTKEQAGRLLVFSLRNHERKESNGKSKLRLSKLGECRMRDPVTAMCSYSKSYMFAASGTMLYQTKIESTSRGIVTDAFIDTRSPISSIRVSGDRVFVSNANDSVSVYEFIMPQALPSQDPAAPPTRPPPKSFEYRRSDSAVRVGADCVPVNDTLAICSDKLGCLFALLYVDHPYNQTMPTQFTFELNDPILRLYAGSLVQRPSQLIRKPDASKQQSRSDKTCLTMHDGHLVVSELADLDLGWWPSTVSTDASLDDDLSQLLLPVDGVALDKDGGVILHESDSSQVGGLCSIDTQESVHVDNSVPWQPTAVRDISFPLHTFDKQPLEATEIIPRRPEGGQMVYGVTLSGTLVTVMHLQPDVFVALALLQHIMNSSTQTRLNIDGDFYQYRQKGSQAPCPVDVNMVTQFLSLSPIACKSIVDTWNESRSLHLSAEEQIGICSQPMTVESFSRLLIWLDRYCV